MIWLLSACVSPTTLPTVPTASTPLVCSETPPTYALTPPLDGPRANKSMVFHDGALFGWSDDNLLKAEHPDDRQLVVPGVRLRGGMVFLDDGTLIASEHTGTENVLRITPEGSVTVLSEALRAYGLVAGPDGMLYATAEPDTVYRIDPVTGATTPWVEFPPDVWPRIADFSPSFDRLYVGTRNDNGTIWVIDLDDAVQPLGPPWLFATTEGTFHDVLVTDACGDLYVTSFYGAELAHISRDGVVTPLAQLEEDQHIHAAAWGAGPNWDDQTLYLAHPYLGNVVSAWDVGVPGRRR